LTADTDEREAGHPVLLCFDGSDDAAAAIAQAAELLASRRAVVLTVWEPVATWESYDPATAAPMAADDVTHHFVPEQGGSCDPLATLPGDGPTGQQLDADGPVPW
jgi:hypothetical protein